MNIANVDKQPRSQSLLQVSPRSGAVRHALAFAGSAIAMAMSSACMAQPSYTDWYNMATAQTVSPAPASPTDLVFSWNSPDGRPVVARIRQPIVTKTVTATLTPPPAGADARPYFEAFITSAIAAHANQLIIPAGTYVFKTVNPLVNGQWAIGGLSDAVIQGNGAHLVFANNAGGIYMYNCLRVKLTNFVLDYALKTTSWATMVNVGGKPVLQIDPATPVTAADGIGHLTEYNKATLTPTPDDLRIYTPGVSDVSYNGNQQYTSALFSKSWIGKTFLVYHHYYGGVALKLMGDPHAGAKQSEDITIESINIVKSPGMGIIVYGVKRGVAIVNSQISPASGEAASSEYDAVHVFLPGGDLVIDHNTIAGAGDDNLNLDSPVSEVVSVNGDGTSMVLNDNGNYPYFFGTGDTLAAFDGNFNYLGTAHVVSTSNVSTGKSVVIDQKIPGLAAAMYIRDVNMSNNRVVVSNNKMSNGGNMLVQVGNVRVNNNSLVNTGLRILSDIGPFKEGMGGLNVLVENNSFNGGKLVNRYNFPFGAITSYGLNAQSTITTNQVNRYLTIRNNTIVNAPQACISIGSAYHAVITGNTCTNANASTPGGYDMDLINDVAVNASQNTLNPALPVYTSNSTSVQ